MKVIQKEQLMGIKDRRWGRQRSFPRIPANQPDQSGRSAPATLSLAGYSPRGGKESDMNARLSTQALCPRIKTVSLEVSRHLPFMGETEQG